MEYVDSMKHRNKKRDKADRLKLRMGLQAPEVQATIAEEEEVRTVLRACCCMITDEKVHM